MNQQETVNEIGRLNLECTLIQAQMNLARAEEQLTIKKVKWYECALFGGAGIDRSATRQNFFLAPT